MAKRSKDGGGAAAYTDEVGHLTVMPQVLLVLQSEGKLATMDDGRAPGSEVVQTPQADETVVFMAFLDAGFRLPCAGSVVEVL